MEDIKNLDAEQHFLGALMLNNALLESNLNSKTPVQVNDFFSKRNRILYDSMLQLIGANKTFDATVVCADLENKGLLDEVGGKLYVAKLLDNTSTSATIDEYARIIVDCSKRRKLLKVAERVQELCLSPQGKGVDSVYDEAQSLLFALSDKNANDESSLQEMPQIALDLIQRIKEDMANGVTLKGISTGFHGLDNLTSGLQAGSLNILGARPAVGKTAFAMNIVENIATNPEIHKPALIFSLEMPASQIAMRMLSSFGSVPMRDLSFGKVSPLQWHDIVKKMAELQDHKTHKNKLFIDDSGALTPIDLRTKARKISREFGGLSVIVVDYLQLMTCSTRAENRSLEIGSISRSLKLLAKELNVPVIALSQLNREVEGRKDHRPLNSDLRESGSLEQDADLIMFLHRESVYHDNQDASQDQATLIVSKNRHGATGDIPLKFDGACTTFKNI